MARTQKYFITTAVIAALDAAGLRQGIATREAVIAALRGAGIDEAYARYVLYAGVKIAHGKYDLSVVCENAAANAKTFESVQDAPVQIKRAHIEVATTSEIQKSQSVFDDVHTFTPSKNPFYQKYGHFDLLKSIFESRAFFPLMITGPSGNGKSEGATQAAVESGREFVRFQISKETDAADFIGTWILENGNTIFRESVIMKAMRRGAIVLLDEMDRGSNAILALQGIMEGNGILIKATGEYVKPQDGFTIVATANTKGRGDETGRFASSILDDAFLERFNVVVEQDFPPANVEEKMLAAMFKNIGKDALKLLVKFANTTRETYKSGGINDQISTRRLIQICKTIGVLQKGKTELHRSTILRGIALCVERYDNETKTALYTLADSIIPLDFDGASIESMIDNLE